ncbi:MAG: M42 family metallopeptidase [Eubacteriales bacterium]
MSETSAYSSELYGIDLLRALCLEFGPSGCEDNVASIIKAQISPYADEIWCDKIGNVIALLRGERRKDDSTPKRLLFSAHMDEVGFMIRDIESDGTLRFTTVGGILPSVLPGRRVTVGDADNRVPGVIGSKAIHLQKSEERDKPGEIRDMYIDIGAKDKEEAEKYVRRGSFGTFESEFIRFGKDGRFIKSKAIDDRFGCAIQCDLLRMLKKSGERFAHDIYFAFTVREETGLSGARVGAYAINPDRAVVLEATAVADNTGAPIEKLVAKQGEGPAISILDNTTIYPREMIDFVMKLAEAHGIKAQYKKYVSGGNDAGAIHKVRAGVKTVTISAPTRYIHTASNVLCADDYDSTLALTAAIAREITFDE